MAQVEIEVVDPEHPDARYCVGEYFAELALRFEGGFDPALSVGPPLSELRSPAGLFLLATLDGEPVGCAGLKLPPGEPAYVKRMWVAPAARGHGLGRRLLGELERRAAEAGAPAIQLETNRSLNEAIALYRSAGYREVEAFNDERYGDHWFEKRLDQAVTPAEDGAL